MDCSRLPGNEALKRQLSLETAQRGLSHAYVVSGPTGCGKHVLADMLAQALVCSAPEEALRPCGVCHGCQKAAAGIHPDILRVGGEEKDLTVAQVRVLRADAYIRPNEAGRKVYLIERADTMNASCQNALLKLLEEGPGYAAFLLLAENAGMLLPTIRSRCEVLSLTLAAAPTAKSDEALALAHCLLSGDELSRAEHCVQLEKLGRDEVCALLDETVEVLRDRLLGDLTQAPLLLSRISLLKTLRNACGFNVGVGHLAGWLAAGCTGERPGA